MGTKIFSSEITGKHVLVAPLDWGLGHATRCIPVIHKLLEDGKDLILAATGSQAALLAAEFPQVRILTIPAYDIRYPTGSLGLNMLTLIPRILKAIKNENKWLPTIAEKYGIDTVISDNRYGLYNKDLECIFITHQLGIRSPFGKFSQKLLQKWNYRYINRFDQCWVPDLEGKNNLAGILSHPDKLPSIPVRYIGPLTRFQSVEITESEKMGHILFINSGPEPPRGIFEDMMVNELVKFNGTATIIRGLPNSQTHIPSTNHLRFYDHLNTHELTKEIAMAEFVVARSGYSTIMDMLVLKKKCIFIPTPGQTEQEYLAQHLFNNKMAYYAPQKGFSLEKALVEARKFQYAVFNPQSAARKV